MLSEFRKTENADRQVKILTSLNARWDLLADSAKGPEVWEAIARQMGPQALRMNLNTLVRQKVIGHGHNHQLVDEIAARIADVDEIRPFAPVSLPVPGGVPERLRRGSAEDQGGSF